MSRISSKCNRCGIVLFMVYMPIDVLFSRLNIRLTARNKHPILLVICPSFGVAARVTYAYMRLLLRLESGPNSSAILDIYFLPQALGFYALLKDVFDSRSGRVTF